MYRLVLFLCLVFSFSGVFAQWQQLNGPYGMAVRLIAARDSVFYAASGGQIGEIYRSSDQGNHWYVIADGLPEYASFQDLEVCGLSGLAIASNRLYRADPPDYQWQESWAGIPGTEGASALFCNEDFLLAGTSMGIYRSVDNGFNWTDVSGSLYGNAISDIAEYQGIIYASTYYGEIYCSSDTCVTWHLFAAGTPCPDERPHGMTFRDSLFFIAGDYSLFRVSLNGGPWETCNLGVTEPMVMCVMQDSSCLYTGTWSHGILRSLDEGNTWEPVGDPQLMGNVTDLVYADGKLTAAVSRGVMYSEDRGDTWTIINTGLKNTSIISLDYDSEYLYATTYLGFYRSPDEGESWELILPTWSNGPVFCYDSLLFATPQGNPTYGTDILRSADHGNTWESASGGMQPAGAGCLAARGEFLFAANAQGVFRSNNNGNYWSKILSVSSPYDIECTDDFVFVACYGATYRSSNHGNTWILVNGGLTNYAFFALGANDSLIFAGSSYLYRSDPDTVQWVQITNGLTLPAAIEDILAEDSVVYAGDRNGVMVSRNSGAEWFLFSDGFQEEYVFVHNLMIKDSILYAGTYRGLWKIPLSELYRIECSPDTVTLDFVQSDFEELIIRANTAWSLTGTLPGWLTADPLSGTGSDTIVFTATEPNLYDNPRYAGFTLVSPSAPPVAFTVRQEAFEGYTTVSSDSLVIDFPEGSGDSLFIQSNTSWEIDGEMPAWLTASERSGIGSDTVIFAALEKNPTEQSRSAEFVINSYQAVPVNLSVTQKGKPTAIEEEENPETMIFPVPSDGYFRVECRTAIREITVYAIDGSVICRRKGTPGIRSESFHIDRKGLFLIEVSTEDRVFRHRMICY